MITTRPGVLLVGDQLHMGGTEGQFVEVACGLDRSRWDIHLTCLRVVGPQRARIEAAGMRVWSCGPGSFKSPRFAVAVVRLARYLRTHRISLVHCFDFYSNVLGVIAGRLAGVRAVIASQRELGDLRTPLQRRIYRLAMRLADYTLVNTEVVAERLVRARVLAPERIVMIPNGVDTRRFSPAPALPRRLTGYPTVGTLACLRAGKGLEHLVRALALVRARCLERGAPAVRDAYSVRPPLDSPRAEPRFVIWGGGPLHAELERLIADVGLTGSAELCGPTTQPEAALRAMDIFVLPSLSEACSNVLLEAMATGLPLVATRVGGNPALVDDDVSGLLVPAADPDALAKAIIRLVEDPALAERLGASARQEVSSHFGLDRMLSRVEALYGQALETRPRRAPGHTE
jgi:glycosyltransferase involved in cell wall biosynthesis